MFVEWMIRSAFRSTRNSDDHWFLGKTSREIRIQSCNVGLMLHLRWRTLTFLDRGRFGEWAALESRQPSSPAYSYSRQDSGCKAPACPKVWQYISAAVAGTVLIVTVQLLFFLMNHFFLTVVPYTENLPPNRSEWAIQCHIKYVHVA